MEVIMLSEFEQSVVKNHKLDEEKIDHIEPTLVVVYKDGSKHQIVECWSRCMGYYRPMSEYNIGKRQEHEDRKYFVQPGEDECSC